jgi:AbrB family looped-hinge helix DNA binding protein
MHVAEYAMTTRLTSKGQVTIPKGVRDELNLRPGDEIEFVRVNGHFQLKKHIDRSVWDKWDGFLKHLEGQDVDELIEEMRGR